MRFIYVGVVAWVVLTVFTTVFAISSDSKKVRVLSKPIWIALCALVPVFGAILYLTIGRPLSENQPQTRTVAPDDDPEFLRRLAERLKKEDDDKDDQANG